MNRAMHFNPSGIGINQIMSSPIPGHILSHHNRKYFSLLLSITYNLNALFSQLVRGIIKLRRMTNVSANALPHSCHLAGVHARSKIGRFSSKK
jgi:hypothetical protein